MTTLRHRSFAVCLFAALFAFPLPAAEPRLVANLDTSVAGVDFAQLGSGPDQFVVVGERALFLADTPEHGREPWVSDGTVAGTRLLVDTCPGPASGVPGDLEVHRGLTILFFVLPPCPPAIQRVVWRTDGTSEGTRVLLPFDSFDDRTWSAVDTAGDNLLVLHAPRGSSQQFFFGIDGVTGAAEVLNPLQPFGRVVANLGERTLYRRVSPYSVVSTDGTLSGTRQIAVLEDSVVFGPTARFGDDAVVLAYSSIESSIRLIRIGHSAGALATLSTVPGADGFSLAGTALVAGTRRIFFLPSPGDLWVSDGTPAGTRRVVEFDPSGTVVLPPGGELPGGKWLFFRGASPESLEPWVTDGTAAGTFSLGDLCPGTCGSVFDPTMVASHGRVIFRAFDPVHGTEPWSTDGTPAGTALLGDFCPGLCSSAVTFAASSGGDAWMIGAETFNPAPGDDRRLLRTDGTAAGTRVIASFPDGLLMGLLSDDAAGVFFGRRTEDRVPELWHSHGQTGDAERLVTFGGSFRERGAEPRDVRVQAGRLLFAAHGTGVGDQIWTSDGTEADTRTFSAILGPTPTILSSAVTPMKLVAAVEQGVPGAGGLVAVDLADGATTVLSSPEPLGLDADSPLARLGAEVVAGLPGGGLAVTRLPGGTVEILGRGDFVVIPQDPPFVSLGGRLYFLAESDGQSRLWETDGTAAGTRRTLPGERTILRVVALGDRLIVTELDEVTFQERILSLVPRPGGLPPLATQLGTVGRTALVTTIPGKALIFFDEALRIRLAVTDGTPAGTTAIGPQLFTTWRSVGPNPVALGGTLYFAIEDLRSGAELWRTDGTRLGTRRVADLVPGPGSSHPSALRAVGDRLFFAASDGLHGNELWTSDGTPSGTHRLTDLAPGADSANPADFTALASDLFFAATDGTTGRELWALSLADLPPALPPSPSSPWLSSTAVPGFRFQVRFDGGRLGRLESACLAETLCISGAVPGRPEVFLRVVGPKPNGFLWPTLVKFTTASVEIWVEQPATGEIRYYQLPGARPGFDELPGLFDREGFRPAPAALTSASESGPDRSDPEPPADGWFTTPAVPGFRIAVQIQGAPSVHQEPCIAETLCVSGALPGRPEVFVRVVGPKPNGRLWPTLVKFSTSQVDVWVEQVATGIVQKYTLAGAVPGRDDLTGLFDRVGFRP